MKRNLSSATIKTPLLEIDGELRGMLLSDRGRATAAVAIHLCLRIGHDYVFWGGSDKATLDEVTREIVYAIWRVPLSTITQFAKAEDKAGATDAIAQEVLAGLPAAFEAQYAREPYGG
ncbi:hypothetical protein ACFHWW_04850 [Ensifer sp. P24N7]|uniref:hypothetical protein n=1 Tax=Sinorhizobium sp. P24N7 TaxID=3348358 RepID=UPI0035F3BF9C